MANDCHSKLFTPLLEVVMPADDGLKPILEELEPSREELLAVNAKLVAEIAELRRREVELNLADATLGKLIASAGIATLFLDRKMQITRFTPAVAAMFNLTRSDIDRSFLPFANKINWSSFMYDVEPVLEGHPFTERVVATPGGERWFLVRVFPNLSLQGCVEGVMVNCSDITEQKRMEDTLKESKQNLQLFIEHAPAALAMFDADMRYLKVSNRWLEVYGLGERDLTGESHYDVFPEITAEVREAHRRGLDGEVLRVEADHFERADGSVQWIRWEIRPWYDAAGRRGGIVIFTEDLTRVKKADDILGRYELLAKCSRDIIMFVRREDGRILEANAAAENAYGYDREELLGLTVKELRVSEYQDLTAAQMTEADTRGILFETVHRRKDGSNFPAEVSSQGTTIGGSRILISIIRDISKRKRSEAEIVAGKVKLEAALESMTDAVFISDAEGRFVEFNHAFAAYYRFRNKDEYAKCFSEFSNILEVFLSNGEPAPLEQWAVPRALRGETSNNAEYTLRRKDSGETWSGSYSFAPIRDHDGRITGSVVTARDITERKRAEESLRMSEERYRSLVEIAPFAILINRDNRIEYANPATVKLFGASCIDDLLGRSPYELVNPEFHDAMTERIKILVQGGGVPLDETRILQKDGGERIVEVSATVFVDLQGPAIQVMMHDITDRKQAEEALRESEGLYRSLFRNMLNGCIYGQMIFLDGGPPDFIFRAVNDAFETLTGLTDVVGRKVSEVIPGIQETDLQILETYGRVVRTGQAERFEIFVNALQMWLWVSAYRTGADHFVAVFEVITERKLAEQEILENQQKLRDMAFELQMAEERERSRIAGELHDRVGQRLLLGKMKLDVLSETITDQAEEISGLIEESIQDIRSLTFQLRPPLLATAGLVEALIWLCSELKGDYGLEAEVFDDREPKSFKYEVLSVLYQAVRELLLNVVKHAGTKQARLTLQCVGASLFMTVADEGCGFNPAEHGVIKTKTGGYGLFNLRQKIEYLRGRFECETSPGEGTRATIIFPLDLS